MKSVSNKSRRPISVPLPRGKVLHLGPGRTGRIASNAAEHPPLQELVAAGTIEIVDVKATLEDTGGPSGMARRSVREHGSGSGGRRSGDR